MGSRIIGCCCPSPCPCRLNKKPFHCHGCDHTDAVHIDKGHIGGVKMDGFSYVFVGRGFGDDKDKNWVYVYVTDKATEEQMKAFGGFLQGAVKAMGTKAPYLAGKFVGMRNVPITYTVSANRDEYGVVIPGILELKTRAIVNPGHKEPVVSTGIMDAFGDRFVHAECLSHKYKDASINYEWELTGRQSNFADFKLAERTSNQPLAPSYLSECPSRSSSPSTTILKSSTPSTAICANTFAPTIAS